MPFGVFGWRWEILCSTCFATTFLHIRSRLARSRPSVDETGGRYRIDCSWNSGTAGRTSARISRSTRGHDRCRDAASRRLMDAHRGDNCGDYCGVARLLATWRSVELHHAGNPGCRPGTARTWRLVGRCTTFWMEADRASRTEKLGFLLL